MKPLFHRVHQLNSVLPALLLFVIPVSTALTNVVLGLWIFFWMLDNGAGRFRDWLRILRANPVALMGGAVFLMHLLGVFYTSGENEKIVESLSDGVRFLVISMVMVSITDDKVRPTCLYAFLTAMAVVLILSCLLWLGILPAMIPVKGDAPNCVIFHDHIKHNIFMSFTAFAAGLLARNPEAGFLPRTLWAIFSLTALCNVLFMVAGRTGHVIVVVLLVYYFLTWDRAKSLVAGALLLILLGTFSWIYPSNPFFSRARLAVEEVEKWQYTEPADRTSSAGLRMEWMVNSLKLIKENPFFGTGTGSFEAEHTRLISQTQMTRTDNPHNEYLMTAVQFGITGLLVLLGFFFIQWRYAGSFQDPLPRTMARGFVLLMLTACLTASPLQDSAEGWFFVFMTALLFSISTKSVAVSAKG
jgi:O-antigen ligase